MADKKQCYIMIIKVLLWLSFITKHAMIYHDIKKYNIVWNTKLFCRKVFSVLTRVKSYLRSRTTDGRLNSLAIQSNLTVRLWWYTLNYIYIYIIYNKCTTTLMYINKCNFYIYLCLLNSECNKECIIFTIMFFYKYIFEET